MRTPRRTAAALLGLALLAAPGCQGMHRSRSVASAEPSLNSSTDGGTAVVEAPPPRTATFADRHPLFSKPREYYNNSGNNKLAKTAAAAVVGVPAGIFGEMRQIVAGRPPDNPPAAY